MAAYGPGQEPVPQSDNELLGGLARAIFACVHVTLRRRLHLLLVARPGLG